MPAANCVELRSVDPDNAILAFWRKEGDARECLAVIELTPEAVQDLWHQISAKRLDSPALVASALAGGENRP